MIRRVYTPHSNTITFPIPDYYIGRSLEINIFPTMEINAEKEDKKASTATDNSFGGWADMEKSAEEIGRDIRSARNFRERDFSL
jgi:hypothetical protein